MPSSKTTFRFGFGSCYGHTIIASDSSPMYHLAKSYPPKCFAWLGDATYGDVYDLKNKEYVMQEDMDKLKNRFQDTKKDSNYTLLRTVTGDRIYGVWDDHDSGLDDAGISNPIKDKVRPIYLDFLNEPKDSPRWNRSTGIYGSWFLDKEHKIKLILLDGRYNMDEEDE